MKYTDWTTGEPIERDWKDKMSDVDAARAALLAATDGYVQVRDLLDAFEAAIRAEGLDGPVNVVRLQAAMREAHGRRISMTETYAEAIARRYNARLRGER